MMGNVCAKEIDKERSRPKGNFEGDDMGHWRYTQDLPHGSWNIALGLSLNEKLGFVDGATEDHPGFLKALKEIVREYPEMNDWSLKFDGPAVTVRELLRRKLTDRIRWESVQFYHGTSMVAWEKIKGEGLKPRSETNVNPVYGVGVGSVAGRVNAIYLTTQEGMAHWAAIDAARATKSDAVILSVKGVDGENVLPDEDSREDTAEDSLRRMGSIAYAGTISSSKIRLHSVRESGRWVKVASGIGRIAENIVADFLASRGLQVRRKDKDLMRDTGGISKGRDREPDSKPPRDENKSRYRDKRLKPEQIDNDTNADKDRDVKKPNRRPQAAIAQDAMYGISLLKTMKNDVNHGRI